LSAPYFSPAAGGGKIYVKNLKFCLAAVFVVCQRDNHIMACKFTFGLILLHIADKVKYRAGENIAKNKKSAMALSAITDFIMLLHYCLLRIT